VNTNLKSLRTLSASLVLAACLSAPALGGDVQRHGESYVIYLPHTLPFNEVVDRVQTEILAQNWDVVNVQDLGVGLRKLGVWTENRIIQACQSQYLKQRYARIPSLR
jgi:hypothetical protein